MCILHCDARAGDIRLSFFSGLGSAYGEYKDYLPPIIDSGSEKSHLFQRGITIGYGYELNELWDIRFTGLFSLNEANLKGRENLPFNLGDGRIVQGSIDHVNELSYSVIGIGLMPTLRTNIIDIGLGLRYNFTQEITGEAVSRSFSRITSPPEVLFDNGTKINEFDREFILGDYLSISLDLGRDFYTSENLYLRPSVQVEFIPSFIVDEGDSEYGFSTLSASLGLSIGYDLSRQTKILDKAEKVDTTKADANGIEDPAIDFKPNIDNPTILATYNVNTEIDRGRSVLYKAKRLGERKKGEGLDILKARNIIIDVLLLKDDRPVEDYKISNVEGLDVSITGSGILEVIDNYYLFESDKNQSIFTFDISEGDDFNVVNGVYKSKMFKEIPSKSISYSVIYSDYKLPISLASKTLLISDESMIKLLSEKYPLYDFIEIVSGTDYESIAEELLGKYPDALDVMIVLD